MNNRSKLKDKYNNYSIEVKASLWFLICTFVQRGITVITIPIFTRLLSTSEYGEYGVFNSWSAIITIIVSLSLSGGVYTQGLIKFDNQRNRFATSLYWLATISVFFWTVIYLLNTGLVNRWLSLSTEHILLMLSLSWSGTIVGFWSSQQRIDYCYKRLVLVTVLLAILKPVLSIVLIQLYPTQKVLARILGMTIVEVAIAGVLYIVQIKKDHVWFSTLFWKYGLVLCIPLIPHYLSQTVLTSSDRIMIGKMIGDGEAGIYNLGYSISQLTLIFNSALIGAIDPWLLRKIKENKLEDIGSKIYPIFVFVCCVVIGLILITPEAVKVFAPESFYDAIWIVPPVAISTLFVFEYDIFSAFEFYYEKTKFIAVATIISASLNIILNGILIRQFGYVAAAYTTLICYGVYAVMHFIMAHRIIKNEMKNKNPFNTSVLLFINTGCIVVGFGLMSLYELAIIRYILLISFAIVIVFKRKKILIFVNKISHLKRENKE